MTSSRKSTVCNNNMITQRVATLRCYSFLLSLRGVLATWQSTRDKVLGCLQSHVVFGKCGNVGDVTKSCIKVDFSAYSTKRGTMWSKWQLGALTNY